MTKYGVVGTGYFGAELARFMSIPVIIEDA